MAIVNSYPTVTCAANNIQCTGVIAVRQIAQESPKESTTIQAANIVGRVSLSFIYKYNIQARISSSLIYRYSILSRISLSRIYRYSIQARVSVSRIYRYSILSRVSLARIYRYSIIARLSAPLIYRYGIETLAPPVVITPSTGGGRRRKKSWLALMRRISQRITAPFVRIPKPEEKTVEVEEIEPEVLTHVSVSLTYRYSIEAPKSISVVASVVPPPKPVYPLIIPPKQQPLIQKTIRRDAFAQQIISQEQPQPYRVGQGQHIESRAIPILLPKNKSKTASIVMKLLILSEIEQSL